MSVGHGSGVADRLTWFKSSYSGDHGGACVEVALDWHKSSYSGSQGGACVEVAECPSVVHVRDSKDVTVPHLTVPAAAWSAFVTCIAGGDRAPAV